VRATRRQREKRTFLSPSKTPTLLGKTRCVDVFELKFVQLSSKDIDDVVNLEIESVDVQGDKATARFKRGQRARFEKVGDKWLLEQLPAAVD
jgi:hypothetical protein